MFHTIDSLRILNYTETEFGSEFHPEFANCRDPRYTVTTTSAHQ